MIDYLKGWIVPVLGALVVCLAGYGTWTLVQDFTRGEEPTEAERLREDLLADWDGFNFETKLAVCEAPLLIADNGASQADVEIVLGGLMVGEGIPETTLSIKDIGALALDVAEEKCP